jgi:hypothetical protein
MNAHGILQNPLYTIENENARRICEFFQTEDRDEKTEGRIWGVALSSVF